MAPARWTTQEQFEWLNNHVGKYLGSRTEGEQIDFFVRLDESWFVLWPEEKWCGLPSKGSGIALDEEQVVILAAALNKRKSQLRSWFRNNTSKARASGGKAVKKDDKSSMAAALWKDNKRHRDPQLVELYQKMYPDRVRDGLKEAGYREKHKGDLEFVFHDEKQPDATIKLLLKKQAAERMRVRRSVSRAMLQMESEEVKEEIEAALRAAKERKLAGQDTEKLTPELAQMSLDQLEGVLDRLYALIREKTGWVGFTMLGGPMPNAGGQLMVKVYSCGESPAGHTFKASHPAWKESVGSQFTEFLHRCFSRAARDAMALPDPDDSLDDSLDDLLAMSGSESDDHTPKKSRAPKRPRNDTVMSPAQGAALPHTPSHTLATPTRVQAACQPCPSPAPPPSPAPLSFQDSPRVEDDATATFMPDGNRGWEADGWGGSFDMVGAGEAAGEAHWSPGTGSLLQDLYATAGGYGAFSAGFNVDVGGLGLGDDELNGGRLYYDEQDESLAENEPSGSRLYLDADNAMASDSSLNFRAQDTGPLLTLSTGQYAPLRFGASSQHIPAVTPPPATNSPNLPHAQRQPDVPPPDASQIRLPPPKTTPPNAAQPRPQPRPLHPKTMPPNAAQKTHSEPRPPPTKTTPPTVSQTRSEPRPPPTASQTRSEPRALPTKPTQACPQPPNSSPLPPRIARAGASAIATSSAALAFAMKRAQEEGSDSEEEDIPLNGPAYPLSRPMANAPKPYVKAKAAGGPRGRGGGRGRGRGWRGAVRGGKQAGHARNETEEGDGLAQDGLDEGGQQVGPDEEQENEGAAQGSRTQRKRAPLAFLQTYGDNGEVILLAPSTVMGISAARKKEIRAFEKERDATEKKVQASRRNLAGQHDLVVLARQKDAPMPPVPELGRPGRLRRAPKNANDDAALLEALAAAKRDETGAKRKQKEGAGEGAKKRRTQEPEVVPRKRRKV